MKAEKNIASVKVLAGKRTYFIDVKESREGVKYLNIAENKRLADGKYERHAIMVFEENIKSFVEALQIAFGHFITLKKDEKSRMQQTKEKFENAYKPWKEEDDVQLTEFFCIGKNPEELSYIFKRNIGAINSRIEKLELRLKYRPKLY